MPGTGAIEMAGYSPGQHVTECPRCHVLRYAGPTTGAAYHGPCAACATLEREPQGETVRLFNPAPAQIPGQLDLSMPRIGKREARAEVRAMIAEQDS